jgi:hypothetical protein
LFFYSTEQKGREALKISSSCLSFSILVQNNPVDENQRTKMHSEGLVFPEEFDFSPDEKWLYVELHHGSCMSGADLHRRSNSKAARPNGVGPFQRIEPSLEDGAWAEALKQRLFTKNFAERRTLRHGSVLRVERRFRPVTPDYSWRRSAKRNGWAVSLL